MSPKAYVLKAWSPAHSDTRRWKNLGQVSMDKISETVSQNKPSLLKSWFISGVCHEIGKLTNTQLFQERYSTHPWPMLAFPGASRSPVPWPGTAEASVLARNRLGQGRKEIFAVEPASLPSPLISGSWLQEPSVLQPSAPQQNQEGPGKILNPTSHLRSGETEDPGSGRHWCFVLPPAKAGRALGWRVVFSPGCALAPYGWLWAIRTLALPRDADFIVGGGAQALVSFRSPKVTPRHVRGSQVENNRTEVALS
jgi:hypothetical protein